jgi:predicted metalloenzyme YecM
MNIINSRFDVSVDTRLYSQLTRALRKHLKLKLHLFDLLWICYRVHNKSTTFRHVEMLLSCCGLVEKLIVDLLLICCEFAVQLLVQQIIYLPMVISMQLTA